MTHPRDHAAPPLARLAQRARQRSYLATDLRLDLFQVFCARDKHLFSCDRRIPARQDGHTSLGSALGRQRIRELDALSRCSGKLVALFRQELERPGLPDLKLIDDALAARPDEFDTVAIGLGAAEVAVTTPPIVLDEVNLSPCEIRFSWYELAHSQPYRVVALEPRCAAADDETTHPHVQSKRLCSGGAQSDVRAALASGRLSDFFLGGVADASDLQPRLGRCRA